MSILIRDMEMPKACWECPLKVHLFQQLWCTPSNKVINRDDNTEREPDCPLVEVKEPHGRLLDEDKMIEEIHPFVTFGSVDYTELKQVLKTMNAVIEAEGSE